MSDDLSGFSLMDLFRSEADGQVATLTEGLIALESTPTTLEAIEPLMRAAHSLKGAARIVGLDPAVRIAHSLEDAFVGAQRSEFVIQAPHVDIMLRAVDLLARIAQLEEGHSSDWEVENEATLTMVVGELDSLRNLSVEVPAVEAAPGEVSRVDTGSVGPAATEVISSSTVADRPVENLASVIPTALTTALDIAANPVEAMTEVASNSSGPVSDASGRVVRVSAESLSRMMALAGESLVQARQLRPFVDALTMLKRQHLALSESLRSLENRLEAASQTVGQAELLVHARSEADRCDDALTRNIESFDEFTRRSEDLAGRLHHEVIASRMRPISEGVRGFPRLVREVSRDLGKQVRFRSER